MEAMEILQRTPAQLFPGDPNEVHRLFKEFADKWHPDRNKTDPRATEVFQHLVTARAVALGKSDHNRLTLTRRKDDSKFSMDYLGEGQCEASRMFVGPSTVAYLVRPQYADLCEPALKWKWEYADDKMRTEMSRFLPRQVKHEVCLEGTFLAYRRDPDQLLFSDVLEFEKKRGKTLDYRHVMWIVSSLLNTCCYFQITKVAHCGIIPEYLMISPKEHNISLTGPPLYATPYGMRPKAVPRVVLDIFPRLRTPGQVVSDSRIDLTLVRRIALKALGYTSFARAKLDKTLHPGLREWLCSPAPMVAVDDYINWEKLRGKRAFLPYDATSREIYDALRN